ncbi:MAG: ATPase [Caldimicrobium thiodismutans]|uniref:ATPase n=1 Tax=Caldimicrobium thiodismutans TaxID=1653476 RepID=A0A2N7PJE1_9BACT|nr:MAG: ATPase [Caldimicrobium thiodismutans]
MLKAGKPKIERINLTQSNFLLNFDLKPVELEAYLDEYLIGQNFAKGIIATKICTHFHKAKSFLMREPIYENVGFVKNNIIIIGPTGVGKTFIIKLIAKKLGVPFIKGDATKFSETGYVGGDVEDLVRDLYYEAGGDLEKARFGIIYLDEIDKIASPGEVIGPDVSRTGVQRALLKLLEETEVEIKMPHEGLQIMEYPDEGKNKRKKITLNTKYILFVVSGAFQGLEEIIKKRLKKQSLGFLSEIEGKEDKKINYMKFVTPEDLVAYGFEREFVGRFPVIAVFDPLTEEELYQILANPNNVIMLNKKRDFKVYGIDLAFTDTALREIAKLAYKDNTGARALVRVLESSLISFERILPSKSINYLGVTEELVRDPEGYLKAMLNNPSSDKWVEAYTRALNDERQRVIEYLESKKPYSKEVKSFEITPKRLNLLFEIYKGEDIELIQALERLNHIYHQIKAYETSFSRRNQIQAVFTEDAIDHIMEEVVRKDQGVFPFCEKFLSRFEYTFSLLKETLQRNRFYITRLAFVNPDRYLEELITN